MPADIPPDRHLVRVGEVYFQWDRAGRHHLALDLSGPLPEWVVDVAGDLIPLGVYLDRHPGRREEVRQLVRHRLAAVDAESQSGSRIPGPANPV